MKSLHPSAGNPYWIDWHEVRTFFFVSTFNSETHRCSRSLEWVPSPQPQQWVERNGCLLGLSIWLLLRSPSPHFIFK